MNRSSLLVAAQVVLLALALLGPGCSTGAAPGHDRLPAAPPGAAATRRADEVMKSSFCAGCHPAIYAEHEQSTHGRAFTDEEVRLATARFSHSDCIICHTPRPIFETGIGMNPMRRHYDLEGGNTCMTCHWKPGFDYEVFEGGAECKEAFDPRVGEVEACASCHRNHGTPYQWDKSPTGRIAGKVCVDCHMPSVIRPVAAGEPPRKVRPHVFPGGRNEQHLRRAYAYDARIDGNEVVVVVKNKGAGHNFPTELKQRSVESVVVVRDTGGGVVATSRMVFRDPYKRPYGLELPVNTQIPGGQEREHRVPVQVAAGTVECELFYKLYYPIDDHHPDLSRRLESRTLVFAGVTPSDAEVVTEPTPTVVMPEGITPEVGSVANLIDFAPFPKAGLEVAVLPEGDSPEDVAELIGLFQFPIPEANAKAQERLVQIGAPAAPALVAALGSWDNKTWNQAMAVLQRIGQPAAPAIVAGLASPELYVRVHARALGARLGLRAGIPALREALRAPNALDRASAATTLAQLGAEESAPDLVAVLADADPDVVRAAALALASLQHVAAVPALERALARATFAETRRDLALALAKLGSPAGIPVLLTGLDHGDDLVRESFFEAFFEVTGWHLGYDPLARREERLEALASLRAEWTARGGPDVLRKHVPPDPKVVDETRKLIMNLGGSDLASSTDEQDLRAMRRLVELGTPAVVEIARGLKFPPGFSTKRARLCDVLSLIGDRDAAPALLATLRDPVLAVAARACQALERVGDVATLPAVRRYEQRVLSVVAAGKLPAGSGGGDVLLAQAARTRLALGDEGARTTLARLLLSPDPQARVLAIDSLSWKYGETRGYDAEATAEERREAAARWTR